MHRTTAARWLSTARTAVSTPTRDHLRETLATDHELDELLALARSKLDRSTSRVLATRPEP